MGDSGRPVTDGDVAKRGRRHRQGLNVSLRCSYLTSHDDISVRDLGRTGASQSLVVPSTCHPVIRECALETTC